MDFIRTFDPTDTTGLVHGIDTSNPHVWYWFLGCPIVHIIVTVIFRALGWFPGKSRHGSALSDVASFIMVAGACVLYLSCSGIYVWTGINGNTVYADLDKDHMYGRSEWTENHLVYPMLGYQIWNLLASLCMNEFRSVQMVVHHVLTGSLAYFGLYPYLQFECLFFFGITEFTNIPLTFVDFFKQFKDYAKAYPGVYSTARTIFGVSFIILRLLIWPVFCYPFWKNSIILVLQNQVHNKFVALYFLFANFLLTGLQFLWGKEIWKAIMGTKKDPKKKSA